MRLHFARQLSVALALLLGVQSTTFATGMHCAGGGPSSGELNSQPALQDHEGMNHGDGHHSHHAAGDASIDVSGAALAMDCDCGPGCGMASCVGTGPGLTSPPPSGGLHVAIDSFDVERRRITPNAGFSSDLIRPPSRS